MWRINKIHGIKAIQTAPLTWTQLQNHRPSLAGPQLSIFILLLLFCFCTVVWPGESWEWTFWGAQELGWMRQKMDRGGGPSQHQGGKSHTHFGIPLADPVLGKAIILFLFCSKCCLPRPSSAEVKVEHQSSTPDFFLGWWNELTKTPSTVWLESHTIISKPVVWNLKNNTFTHPFWVSVL